MTDKPFVSVQYFDPKEAREIQFPCATACSCGKEISIDGFDHNAEPCIRCGAVIRFERFNHIEEALTKWPILGLAGTGVVFGLKKLKRMRKG